MSEQKSGFPFEELGGEAKGSQFGSLLLGEKIHFQQPNRTKRL